MRMPTRLTNTMNMSGMAKFVSVWIIIAQYIQACQIWPCMNQYSQLSSSLVNYGKYSKYGQVYSSSANYAQLWPSKASIIKQNDQLGNASAKIQPRISFCFLYLAYTIYHEINSHFLCVIQCITFALRICFMFFIFDPHIMNFMRYYRAKR